MRQTTKRRHDRDGTVLTKVRARRKALDSARAKVEKADDELGGALLEAAEAGWTMRELADVSQLTLSAVYRRITGAERAA